MTPEKTATLKDLLDRLVACIEQRSDRTEVGGLLRTFRAETGLRPRAFAERVGASEETVQRWLKGQYIPQKRHIEALGIIASGVVTTSAASSWFSAAGLYTWDDMYQVETAEDTRRIWLLSSADFVESTSPDLLKEIFDRVHTDDREYNFVFPAETPAAKSFRLMSARLRDWKSWRKSELSAKGRIVGYELNKPRDIDLAKLFLDARAVLVEKNVAVRGFLSIPVDEEEVRLFRAAPASTASDSRARHIWKELGSEAVARWQSEFSVPLLDERAAQLAERRSRGQDGPVQSDYEHILASDAESLVTVRIIVGPDDETTLLGA